ncbi:putative PPM-type phosphatase domain-containing protein [Helianthus debilis subsp. tardiflorus]
MIQANAVLEDQCHLESGSLNMDENAPRGTFVVVYDGHLALKPHGLSKIISYASENGGMSEEVIRQAFLKTDEEFLVSVEREWENNPKIASVGSCCLAGVICNGMLYVPNAGDSRAVLGKLVYKTEKAFMPVRLSQDHKTKVNKMISAFATHNNQLHTTPAKQHEPNEVYHLLPTNIVVC